MRSLLLLASFYTVPLFWIPSAHAKEKPEDTDPNRRGGVWKKYEGNPKWDGWTVVKSDAELGTPKTDPPTFGEWQVVDGRTVRVVRRAVDEQRVFQGHIHKFLVFYGLEDNKGKVILPCVFENMFVVPGQGVILRSFLSPGDYEPSDRPLTEGRFMEQRISAGFEKYDLKTGKRTPLPGLLEVNAVKDVAGQSVGYEFVSDINEPVMAKKHNLQPVMDKPPLASLSPTVSFAPTPGADALGDFIVRKMRLGRIEVFNTQGERTVFLDRLLPVFYKEDRPRPSKAAWVRYSVYKQRSDDWWCISLPSPTNEVCMQFLDGHYKPVRDPFPYALTGASLTWEDGQLARNSGDGVLIPSPFGEDLWLILDKKDGRFTAPVGSLGLQPLGKVYRAPYQLAYLYSTGSRYSQNDPWEWLVAFNTSEGLRWGYIDFEKKTVSAPLWKNVKTLKIDMEVEVGKAYEYVVAVEDLQGKWRVRNKELPNFLPETYPSLEAVALDYEARAAKRQAGFANVRKAAEHWMNVELPQQRKERSWSDAWSSGSWSTVEMTATDYGGDYFVQFVDRYPRASASQLRKAAGLTSDPAKKAEFERRAAQVDVKATQDAQERRKAIEAQKQTTAQTLGGGITPNWSSWDSWATYRQQSADNAVKLKALQGWTYGRTNQKPIF